MSFFMQAAANFSQLLFSGIKSTQDRHESDMEVQRAYAKRYADAEFVKKFMTNPHAANLDSRWVPWKLERAVPMATSQLHHYMWHVCRSPIGSNIGLSTEKFDEVIAAAKRDMLDAGGVSANKLPIVGWYGNVEPIAGHLAVNREQAKRQLARWAPDYWRSMWSQGATVAQMQESCRFAEPVSLVNGIGMESPPDLDLLRSLDDKDVYVCAYDLSKGYVSQLAAKSPQTLAGVDGIWHLSIIAFNTEYQLGSSVSATSLGGYALNDLLVERAKARGAAHSVIYRHKSYGRVKLGMTKEALESYVRALTNDRFHSGLYDPISNNCIHFVQDVLWFVTGQRVESRYSDQVVTISKLDDGGVQWIIDAVTKGFGHMLTKQARAVLGGMTWQSARGWRSFFVTQARAQNVDLPEDMVAFEPANGDRDQAAIVEDEVAVIAYRADNQRLPPPAFGYAGPGHNFIGLESVESHLLMPSAPEEEKNEPMAAAADSDNDSYASDTTQAYELQLDPVVELAALNEYTNNAQAATHARATSFD